MIVKEIVNDWLKTHGYDGLRSDVGCACEVNDLAPCGGEGMDQCEAGHKLPCDGTCEGGKCDFHIGGQLADVDCERSSEPLPGWKLPWQS